MNRRTFLPWMVAGLLVVAGLAQLCLGPYGISPLAVIRALTDAASPDRFFVLTLGLPRYVIGALVGATLGAAGAIFQVVTRNALASPDILGFGAGSATGVIMTLLFAPALPAALAAVLGGLVTAVIVYGLSGGLRASPRRLILTGIMISAVLSSVNSYMLLNTDVQDTQAVLYWLSGSLNSASWASLSGIVIPLAALLVLSIMLRHGFGIMELGDDLVVTLGSRPEWLRGAWILIAILLVSAAAAVSGPIAFVALAAPHITRRLNHGRLTGLLTPALFGALLVTGCDAVAANLLPFHPPVGILTGAFGGLYLLTLLFRAETTLSRSGT